MIDKVLAEKDMVMLNIICVGIIVVFLLRGIFGSIDVDVMRYAETYFQ